VKLFRHFSKVLAKPPVFVYEKFIARQKSGRSFIILLFFLLTFTLSRLWVYLSIFGAMPISLTENIDGVHIHHFAYGVFIISLVGYFAFALPEDYFRKWRTKLAALFGFGLGWTFDEFGMWMRLRDDYWMRQSYDAIIVISAFLINIIYFGELWKKLTVKILRQFGYNKLSNKLKV